MIMDGKAAPSCLVLAVQAQGKEALTIEGLAMDGRLDPIQSAFHESGAIQCGFCTSGMIMTTKALLDKNSAPSVDEIKWELYGNLCRCTGYAKIVEAVQRASNMAQEAVGGQETCGLTM